MPDAPSATGKVIMKPSSSSGLSDQYLRALATYFDQGLQASLQPAQDVGALAVASGLDTLALAKIHEQALAELLARDPSPANRDELTRRGAVFFTEAIVPIEETHPGALGQHSDLDQLHATLEQRTLDLADSNRQLQAQISSRHETESTLQTSELASGQLLRDSQVLESQLQAMAGKIRCASEDERKKMSLHLNDDIAQTLLGINIRLIALKKMIAANDKSLNVEITTIQRLIEDLAEIINRLAHEFSFHHPRYAD